jgi:hypothetical protein
MKIFVFLFLNFFGNKNNEFKLEKEKGAAAATTTKLLRLFV